MFSASGLNATGQSSTPCYRPQILRADHDNWAEMLRKADEITMLTFDSSGTSETFLNIIKVENITSLLALRIHNSV